MKGSLLENRRKKTELLTECLGAGALAFLFLFRASVNIWSYSAVLPDSAVFKTVSMMMRHGFMPYRDSFDHKGPLLYVLNYLGDSIAVYRGIWVVELLFMTVTFLMVYRIARLTCDRCFAAVAMLVSVSLLFYYFEGGNLVEEYAMPFIAVALYIFLDYLENGVITRGRLVICGACLGGVLLLRPNMIAVWVVFSLAVLVRVWKDRQLEKALTFLLWFLLGAAVMLLPFIIWLGARDALKWCWKVYLEFNKAYISAEGDRALFRMKWSSFFTFFNNRVVLIAFSVQVYLCIRRRTLKDLACLMCLVVSLLLICLSGERYSHYAMVLVPVIVVPLSGLFSLMDDIRMETEAKKMMRFLVCLFLMCSLVLPDWMTLIGSIPTIYDDRHRDHIPKTESAVVKVIEDSTTEEVPISVYGNWDIIYVLSQRPHATRYSYQVPIGSVLPEIMDEYMADLQKNPPEIIVVQQGYYDERIQSFLGKNRYTMIWSETEEMQSGAMVFSWGSVC